MREQKEVHSWRDRLTAQCGKCPRNTQQVVRFDWNTEQFWGGEAVLGR